MTTLYTEDKDETKANTLDPAPIRAIDWSIFNPKISVTKKIETTIDLTLPIYVFESFLKTKAKSIHPAFRRKGLEIDIDYGQDDNGLPTIIFHGYRQET